MNRLSLLHGCGLAIVGLNVTQHATAQERPPSQVAAQNTQVPAAPVATPYPDAAAGDGNTQQGYNPLRWAEDWRSMRDPAKRDNVFDRLKFIPIGSDDVYLTLSGELRARKLFLKSARPEVRASAAGQLPRFHGGRPSHR